MTDEHVQDFARLVRVYLPPGPARQLVGDLMRSKAARDDDRLRFSLAAVFAALREDITLSADDYKNEVKR